MKNYNWKPGELAPGNWVIKRPFKNRQIPAYEVELTPHLINEIHNHAEWHFLEPIPLTPELLKRVVDQDGNGFKKDMQIHYVSFTLGAFSVVYNGKRFIPEWKMAILSMYSEHFRHLHQLQNLVAALSGYEIQLTLKE